MVGIVRSVSAVLVAIALIAAQIMPAWAGCHSQRHAAAAVTTIDVVKAVDAGHHGMSHVVVDVKADMSAASDKKLSLKDPPQKESSQKDLCLGNCSCACGLSGAFLLTTAVAIGAPHGVARVPEFASFRLPLGDRPDGPRRPPRTAA